MMRTGNLIGLVVVAAALTGLGIEASTAFGRAPSTNLAAGAADPVAATSVIEGFAFAPVRVAVGGEVTWRNVDGAPHSVAATDGTFESPLLEQGATFRRSFAQAGTVTYTCTVHPTMRGVVEVVAIVGGLGGGATATTSNDPYRSTGG